MVGLPTEPHGDNRSQSIRHEAYGITINPTRGIWNTPRVFGNTPVLLYQTGFRNASVLSIKIHSLNMPCSVLDAGWLPVRSGRGEGGEN